jgi:hypothetical protein
VLDEYVQASRIDLQRDGIVIDIRLTPGVEIASAVFLQIDSDRDGDISDAECHGYARQVLRDVSVIARDRPSRPTLLDSSCPVYEEVRDGTGTIHVRGASSIRTDIPGRHRIVYRNQHQPERGIYAVNALVPTVRGVTIVGQERDPLQKELRLDYDVTVAARAGVGLAGRKVSALLALALLLGIATRGPFPRPWRGVRPAPEPVGRRVE